MSEKQKYKYEFRSITIPGTTIKTWTILGNCPESFLPGEIVEVNRKNGTISKVIIDKRVPSSGLPLHQQELCFMTFKDIKYASKKTKIKDNHKHNFNKNYIDEDYINENYDQYSNIDL